MSAHPVAGPVSEEEWRKHRAAARDLKLEGLGPDLPSVLISSQQKLLAMTAIYQVLVVEKSRRIGFTWALAADAVLTAAAAAAGGGMDVFYISYSLEMTREFIETAAMWARAFALAAAEVQEFLFKDTARSKSEEDQYIQAFRIRFASGYEIVALSSRPRSLRSKQGKVIIDEAAFCDDLSELIKAAMALLMWGGKVVIVSTHDGDMNPFAELVEDIKKGRVPYALLTVDLDQALRDGLYRRICLVQGLRWTPEGEAAWRAEIIAFYGAGADEELFCVPSSGTGTYISGLLIESRQEADVPVLRWGCSDDFLKQSDHSRALECSAWIGRELIPVLDARLDAALMSAFGEDFALTGDLTVLWPVQIGRDMVRRPPCVVELRNVPYAQQKQIVSAILDRLPRFIGACFDATGNGAPIAQETATRYGLNRIQQIKINEGWYREVMPRFKAAFEDGLLTLPRDDAIYVDLRSIKLKRGVPQIAREPRIAAKGEDAAAAKAGKGQRHGDSAIAAAMAWAASLLPPAEYGYIPVRETANDERDDEDDDRLPAGRWRFSPGAW